MHPGARVIGDAESLVTPGYVNAHQHLTGDRLVHSCIPDAIDSQEAIFGWAVPVHAAHTGDDDELSATLGAIEAVTNGVTCTVEAGTVAHPDRVAAAVGSVGMRATIGQWGWDVDGVPFGAPAAEVLARHSRPARPAARRWPGRRLGDARRPRPDVRRAGGRGERAGPRPRCRPHVPHLAPRPAIPPATSRARVGARSSTSTSSACSAPHVLVAHAVHLDDDELDVVVRTDTAVASCPWAYLRLAQGVTVAGRHGELLARGARLALGCDSENAGDPVDILRAAALFVGLARDRAVDPFGLTAHDALALATIGGARAIGKGATIGSIEVGKRADLVVHDAAAPVRSAQRRPRAAAHVGQRRAVRARRGDRRPRRGPRRPLRDRRPRRPAATRRHAAVIISWPRAAEDRTA